MRNRLWQRFAGLFEQGAQSVVRRPGGRARKWLCLAVSGLTLLPSTALASTGCTAINGGSLNHTSSISDANPVVTTRAVSMGLTTEFFSAGDVISYTYTISSSGVGTAAYHRTTNAAGGIFTAFVGTQTNSNLPRSGDATTSGAGSITLPADITDIFIVDAQQSAGQTGTVTWTVTCNAAPVVPTVTAISPTSGPAGGGTSVTITGTDFTGATAVTFGGTNATFTVDSATQITATAPAATSAGTVDVLVTTSAGTSTNTAADNFTYAAPTVASVTPVNGVAGATRSITITGTNFTSGATVTVGGTPATGVNFVSATSLTATAPARTAGSYNVVVTTGSVSSTATANDIINYYAAPTISAAFAPASVTTSTSSNATLTVTITNPGANPGAISGLGVASSSLGGLAASVTSNSCGGTASVAGSNFSLSGGGSLNAGASCTIVLGVNSAVVDIFDFTPGVVSASSPVNLIGNAGVTTSLQVTAAPNAATTTIIASSQNPQAVGQSVTFTATITSTSVVGVGTVNFTDNGSTIGGCGAVAVTAGTATCTTSSLAVGSRVIAANYSGGTGFDPSAANLTQFMFVAPTISAAFSPSTITTGQTSTLTFTFTNPAANPGSLSGISLDPTPLGALTNYQIAGSTCPSSNFTISGNTLTANSISLLAGASCTFTLNVRTLTAPGTYNVTPGVISATTVGGATLPTPIVGLAGNTTTLTVSPPTLSIGNLTLAEGNAGTTTFAFTVNLSSPAGAGGVTFDIATADGTATAGTDYLANALTGQTIPAGASSYTFNVLVNGDAIEEPTETFNVTISNPTGATLGTATGQGTITNDDSGLVTTQTVPSVSGAVGTALTPVTPVTVAGGTAPYSFALSGGALPSGLIFSTTTGQLSGTPTTALGATTFTVTVTDATTPTVQTSAQSFSLAIAQGAQTISFASTAPTNAIVGGAAYTPAATATSGLAVSFAIDPAATAVCSLAAGVVSFQAAGTCIVNANQAGDTNFAAAGQVQQSFSVVAATLAAPTVTALSGVAVPFNSSGTVIDLSGNISGARTSLAVSAGPSNGTAVVNGETVTYTPNPGFFGADSFSVTATGPGGTSSAATVSVTVATPPGSGDELAGATCHGVERQYPGHRY